MTPSANQGELVVVDYSRLLEPSCDISGEIQSAFGPTGLGIIAIRDVPGYQEARAELLPLAEKLEQLPDEAKRRLEDPDSRFSFGWSFGKESLEDGAADMLKGSFYANPILDVPTTDANLMRTYPSYCRPNLWPREDLPQLEPAFKRLGRVIVDAGHQLAEHCDRFVAQAAQAQGAEYPGGVLSSALRDSHCHKARLLLYKAQEGGRADVREVAPDTTESGEAPPRPLWCAWHLDHGSLTGLARAQYRCDGAKAAAPDDKCGLYIRKQDGTQVQVRIPLECVGFQMGQTMSIMSGGVLCATPHCVKAAQGPQSGRVCRATFAVFMQPRWSERLASPPGMQPSEKTVETWGPWQPEMTFGEFSEKVFSKYYKVNPTQPE